MADHNDLGSFPALTTQEIFPVLSRESPEFRRIVPHIQLHLGCVLELLVVTLLQTFSNLMSLLKETRLGRQKLWFSHTVSDLLKLVHFCSEVLIRNL